MDSWSITGPKSNLIAKNSLCARRNSLHFVRHIPALLFLFLAADLRELTNFRNANRNERGTLREVPPHPGLLANFLPRVRYLLNYTLLARTINAGELWFIVTTEIVAFLSNKIVNNFACKTLLVVKDVSELFKHYSEYIVYISSNIFTSIVISIVTSNIFELNSFKLNRANKFPRIKYSVAICHAGS